MRGGNSQSQSIRQSYLGKNSTNKEFDLPGFVLKWGMCRYNVWMFFVDSNLLQAFVSGAVCTHLFYRSMYTMCIDVANKTLKNNRERERYVELKL